MTFDEAIKHVCDTGEECVARDDNYVFRLYKNEYEEICLSC